MYLGVRIKQEASQCWWESIM